MFKKTKVIFFNGFTVGIKIGIEIAKEVTVTKIQIKVVLLRLNIKLIIINEEKIRRNRSPIREHFGRNF